MSPSVHIEAVCAMLWMEIPCSAAKAVSGTTRISGRCRAALDRTSARPGRRRMARSKDSAPSSSSTGLSPASRICSRPLGPPSADVNVRRAPGNSSEAWGGGGFRTVPGWRWRWLRFQRR